jgi:hypothetical protein
MKLNLPRALAAVLFCALLGSSVNGQTIIKLSLGETGPDLAMNSSGLLGTVSDGDASTTGDQNTAVEYTAFLDSLFADINTDIASFSLAGLQTTGTPTTIGSSVVVQDFFGGTFNLYDPSNILLLSGNLQDSTLTGVIGNTGTGSIFTTKVGTFTSGTLLPQVEKESLNLSIALSNVNNGNGFVVSGQPSALQAFTSDAAVNITGAAGVGVPEPTSIVITLLGAMGFGFIGRRRA